MGSVSLLNEYFFRKRIDCLFNQPDSHLSLDLLCHHEHEGHLSQACGFRAVFSYCLLECAGISEFLMVSFMHSE